MSSFIALRKTIDLSAENNRHLLVGRYTRDVPQVEENGVVVTTLKKHYDISVDIQFDSNGGTVCDDMTYVIGSTYKNLPVPTKAQHIFSGWATATGQILTDNSLVELSNTTLTAQWEYVNIDSDCTEYIVSCNSNYKNTGIYSANRYSTTSAVYIDWGDGNVEKVDGNISKLSHSYTNTGTYSVKVSNNLTSFAPSYNDSAWYNTTSQNKYTFKSMVKTGSRMTSTAAMPSYAFYYCVSLSSIDWLSSCYTGLTALPSYAFYYCQGITSLSSLPSSIKSLGNYAFYYCTGLTGIQDLRNTGLTSLYSSYVFQYCTNVKEWKLPSALAGTYFGSYIFANNSTLSAIQLPESLTAIASHCFYNDTQLKNINIPAKVAVINSCAFYGCTTLSNVSIEATSLTAINQYAFYNCNKLVDLDLPDTVKTIGNYAFYGCTNLNYAGKKITCSAKSYIQDGLIAMWDGIENTGYGIHDENATVWKDLVGNSDMTFELSGLPKSSLTWTENSLLYTDEYANAHSPTSRYGFINISDKNKDFFNGGFQTAELVYQFNNSSSSPRCYSLHGWMDARYGWRAPRFINETDRWFGSGVSCNTIYGDTMTLSSFYRDGIKIKTHTATSKNLSCSVGDSIYILNRGNYDANTKYTYCIRLYNRTLTDEEIQYNHIIDQIRFKEAYPENELNNIEYHLPSQLTSIGSYAYQGCNSLKSLNIPENLQTIGDYAFAGCYQISSIVDKRLTAQTVSTNTFGSATGTSTTAFTGYQTKGNNILCTYVAATGYDDGYWNDPLQEPTKCGFNIQYIDPENIRQCTIIFDAGSGSVSQSTKQVIYGKKIGELPKPICPADKPYFGGWYTEAGGAGTKYSADSTAPSQDSLTLYAFYSAVALKSDTVDLNRHWRQST